MGQTTTGWGGVSQVHTPDSVSTFVDYMFAGGLAYLGSMGDKYVPVVLERFSKATPEERSIAVGGGAMPMHAIHYFYSIRYSEEQAIKAIGTYKSSNPNLTTNQIAALDEISDAIRTKKYRPDYFRMHEDGRPDWSAPESTNSVPHK